MNRRGFLAATAALLITPTLTSEAQQAGKVPRVGFLYQLYRSETTENRWRNAPLPRFPSLP